MYSTESLELRLQNAEKKALSRREDSRIANIG